MRHISYQGTTKNAAEWARELGISPNTIYKRAKMGYTKPKELLFGRNNTQKNKIRTKSANSTICWDCANARADRCPWVFCGIPVKGWTATPRIINNTNGKNRKPLLTDSYIVIDCPKYVEEPFRQSEYIRRVFKGRRK